MNGFISKNVKVRQASFLGIISESAAMQRVFSLITKVAKTSSTVLVLGESGTGKELIARAIHKSSGRSGKLVPVNCGAIPEEILESELFGHEKGAFTGAVQSKIGRFQLADQGTIFLDEIGEMSPKLQVKLLRVLQERVVEPVGSTKSVDVNVRVIAATNKDLREEVRQGRFREDLYYRLQVVPVELPALCNRGDDVALLTRFFLERVAEQNGMEPITVSDEAMEALKQYRWPGNVRELENVMERLAILADGPTLKVTDLPEYMISGEMLGRISSNSNNNAQSLNRASISTLGSSLISSTDSFSSAHLDAIPDHGLDFNAIVDDFENSLIVRALEKTRGNKKAAARLLKLNRTTLVEKIKKKGLESKIEVLTDSDDELPTAFEPSYATVQI